MMNFQVFFRVFELGRLEMYSRRFETLAQAQASVQASIADRAEIAEIIQNEDGKIVDYVIQSSWRRDKAGWECTHIIHNATLPSKDERTLDQLSRILIPGQDHDLPAMIDPESLLTVARELRSGHDRMLGQITEAGIIPASWGEKLVEPAVDLRQLLDAFAASAPGMMVTLPMGLDFSGIAETAAQGANITITNPTRTDFDDDEQPTVELPPPVPQSPAPACTHCMEALATIRTTDTYGPAHVCQCCFDRGRKSGLIR